MSPAKNNPVHAMVEETLRRGEPMSFAQIKELRDRSRGAIRQSKIVFWVLIALVNLLFWVPRPAGVDVLWLVIPGVLLLLVAVFYPILNIRNQQRLMFYLEACAAGPKKRRASEEGRAYMEKVKSMGRTFINAELEVLEGRDLAQE